MIGFYRYNYEAYNYPYPSNEIKFLAGLKHDQGQG